MDFNQKQNTPEDTRNMVIFFLIAALLYFGYSNYVLKPQREVLLRQQEQAASLLAEPAAKPLPRDEIVKKGARIEIDNGQVSGTISLTGGSLDDIALHEYFKTLHGTENQTLLSPKGTDFTRYIDYGWVTQDGHVNVPDAQTVWQTQGNSKLTPATPVTLSWDNGQGLRFERIFEIDDQYLFTVTQNVVNNSGKPVTLYPFSIVAQTGLPHNQGRVTSFEGPIGYVGEKLITLTYKNLRKGKSEIIAANSGWAGITDKYWLTGFIPAQNQPGKYSFKYSGDAKDKTNTGRYQVDYVGGAMTVQAGATAQSVSHVFTGAKKVLALKEYGDKLGVANFDLAVDFGWLWFLSKPFFYALHFLGQFTGNMGVAIILLTLLIRSSVFPLTNTSYKSFAKMKKVAPQISELREKYGEDKSVLQQKIMEMYQREGVNPMAGCIPMVLQIPIFLALYKTLVVTIEMRHAPFFGWIQDLSAPDPTTVFNLFGLIPWTPPAFLHIGVWPCLMLLVMIVQRKLNPPPQDPLQRDMAMYFPFMMTFMLSKFAAGLVVYWTFSALVGVIQQMIIMRSMNVPIYLFGQSPEEEKLEQQVKDGPAVHPLAEMAEERMEEVLFGDPDDDNSGAPKTISPPKPRKKKKK